MGESGKTQEIYKVLDRVRKGAGPESIDSIDKYEELYKSALQDPEAFWSQQAKRLDWFRPWTKTLDWDFKKAHVSWFEGGYLNAAYNCLDRHLEGKGDQVALIWEQDEAGKAQKITYLELYEDVCRFANVLKDHGVRKGDRVCLYLPMIPELAVSVLACARIGAVHSVIFAGFSADAIRDRVLDCGAKVLVTADEGVRGGKKLPLKAIVDASLDDLQKAHHPVDAVLVVKRSTSENSPADMNAGRDFWFDEELKKQRPVCPPEWLAAEDPLFILYTSGSTGKPKGAMHTTGGYLTYVSLTHKYVFDYREGDIYFCAADIGWITGHSYILYGPLANGATTVMFESTPTYPDPGRYWRIVQEHKVNIFYTAPTAIRALAREGVEHVKKYDRSSLRVLGSVGEPINPEAWEWYYHEVGEGRCSLVDTWWQTETGGIMITPLPAATDLKPGSATRPFFGVQPCLLSQEGEELKDTEASGLLCIKFPWPGMARTVYRDHQRFFETYFSAYPGYYFTGDGCRRDKDGYYWITGRVDDVLNVSGHRLGTAEIESSLNSHPDVAESAVVGVPHDIKGTGVFAFVVLKKDAEQTDDLHKSLQQEVAKDIGSFAKPDWFQVVPGLPKTRSGKIMRRILRKVASGEFDSLGNVTTLADPSIVDEIVKLFDRDRA